MAEESATAGMEIDTAVQHLAGPSTGHNPDNKPKPRFEIKKYNAVALWAWGKLFVDQNRREDLRHRELYIELTCDSSRTLTLLSSLFSFARRLQTWLSIIAPFAVTISWMLASNARQINLPLVRRIAMLRGECVIMLSTFTVFRKFPTQLTFLCDCA